MTEFNARSARAKRPCPLWVDAFQRDTQHLGADEAGAYFLILMAMWTRESCDFPDDDARLARVCRVSLRLWRSRIGPVLKPFFKVSDGTLRSKRLREEATYVERQVRRQSDRKNGENPDNHPEYKEPTPSADVSTDAPRTPPRHHPSQLPNYPTNKTPSFSPVAARDSSLARHEVEQPFDPPSDSDVDQAFGEFMAVYPKRTGRHKAQAEFLAAAARTPVSAIIAGARAYAEACRGVEPQFVKDPANWLRDQRWTDEHAPPKPSDPEREARFAKYRRIQAQYQ